MRTSRPVATIALMVMIAALVGACTAASSGDPTTAPDPTVTRPAAPEGELPDALQRKLQGALDQTMTEYGVPGAAVRVWVPGEGAWTKAAGLADIDEGVPASTDLTWPLRSVTKSYTVTLILQLVDERTISLDDTIDEYVDGVTNGDTITLRQLAGMSSGNADYTDDDFLAEFGKDPSKVFTLDELNSFVLGRPELFAPGSKKVYTNANTNLLGAVVEKATKRPFAEVLRERILTPLGQQDTRYILDVDTWTEPHPVGYAPGASGPEPQIDNLSIFGPAGSMITTIEDGRVWGEILATGALLEPETQAERQQGAPLDAGPPYDLYALGMGQTDGWWGHNGEGLGFTAAVFHHPASGATVVVFMNESNVVPKAHPADQLFRRVAEILEAS
ncbi:MAG TPA: serine hydrolase domain-containing protein [Microlunatus sp.]